MVRKAIVEKSLLKNEMFKVEQLVERSENISDEAIMLDIFDDELLRHTTQAILEVVYRTKFHRNSRIVGDSMAVAKLLLGFGHDVNERLTNELQRQMGEQLDTRSLNPEPYSGDISSEADLDNIFAAETIEDEEVLPVIDPETLPKAPRIRRKRGEKVDEDVTEATE